MGKPRYLVLETQGTFIGDVLHRQGSVIATDSSPGPHLKPLNKEAKARMEAWYEESVEYTTYKESGEPEMKLAYPHRRFRIKENAPGVQASADLIRGPRRDDPGGLSLGETLVGKNTDQRPGPTKFNYEEYEDDGVELEPASDVEVIEAPKLKVQKS